MWNQSTKKLMLLNSDLKMITLAAVCRCSLLSWKLSLVQAVYMVEQNVSKTDSQGTSVHILFLHLLLM